jgi:Tfp pilus assembly protein PilO
MSTIIIIFLIIVIVLAVIGMGWANFISSVFNGFDKVKNSPLIKNLTETSKIQVNKIVNSNG